MANFAFFADIRGRRTSKFVQNLEFRLRRGRRSRGSGPNLVFRGKFDPSGGLRGVEIQNFLPILGVPLTPNSAKKTEFLVMYVNPGEILNP